MCNLYSVTKGQDAIRQIAKALRDTTGNLPPFPAIFPDTPAPVVRTAGDGVRELSMMRWGLPSSQKAQLDAATKRAAASWSRPRALANGKAPARPQGRALADLT